jgi:aconitate hydratase
MLAAGLLAKKAVERADVRRAVKTRSHRHRVVTTIWTGAGLQEYLDQLGFRPSATACTTCIGNSGRSTRARERPSGKNDLVVASVLSGNRNFEARVHQSVKANFLMSPAARGRLRAGGPRGH